MKIQQGPHKCPVCGTSEFPFWGSYDVCETCGWEDDPVQENNPDMDFGANMYSLNEYKKKYEDGYYFHFMSSILESMNEATLKKISC